MKTSLPKILTIVALLSGFQAQSSNAQIIVKIASTANDTARAYSSGSAFVAGSNPLFIGDQNTASTQTRSILKWDIAQFAGMTINDATFNFNVEYLTNAKGFTQPYQIDVLSLNYDKTAAAFVVGDLTTLNVTSRGSFNVSATGNGSWNATAALQAAVNSGFDYLSLKLVNYTVDQGGASNPGGSSAFVGLNALPNNLKLSVDAVVVPEPSDLGLVLGAGLLVLLGRRTFRRTKGHLS